MSISVTKKNKNSVFFEQITIIVLLVAIFSLGLITVYKYIVKEPSITPSQMEVNRLSKMVKSNPSNQASRLMLAYAYQRDKDYQMALQEYSEALKTNPKELAALYNIGVIYLEMKNYKESEKFLKKVLQIKDTHVLGAMALGEVYISLHKYDDAIKVLDKAIATQSQIVRPRILKAQALEKKGNKKEAIREYQEVLKFVPTQEEALTALKRLK